MRCWALGEVNGGVGVVEFVQHVHMPLLRPTTDMNEGCLLRIDVCRCATLRTKVTNANGEAGRCVNEVEMADL